jgi:NAD(P)H-hydrate epimerase
LEATAATWPIEAPDLAALLEGYAHALLIGPGLGRSASARRLLTTVLDTWRGPTVLDADAITLFEGQLPALAAALVGRPALLTPHVSELARLLGTDVGDVIAHRFEIAAEAARVLGATILLKGVPTVITDPSGIALVSATGTPVLAAAGSGDVLAGIAVTLMAQTGDPFASGACAAWVHGRAAEIAGAGRPQRGVNLDDVLAGLGLAWRLSPDAPQPPVLAELPAVVDAPVLRP